MGGLAVAVLGGGLWLRARGGAWNERQDGDRSAQDDATFADRFRFVASRGVPSDQASAGAPSGALRAGLGTDAVGGGGTIGEDPTGGGETEEQPLSGSLSASPAGPLQRLSSSQLVELVQVTGDRWVKADAIEELAGRHAIQSQGIIATLLRDSDREVRRAAADALADLGAEDQVAPLASAASLETDRTVRAVMEAALRELQRP